MLCGCQEICIKHLWKTFIPSAHYYSYGWQNKNLPSAYETEAHQKYQLSAFRLTVLKIDCRYVWSSFHPCLRLWQIASSALTWCGRGGDSFSRGTKNSFIKFAVPTWSLERSGQCFFYFRACFLLCCSTWTRNIST